MNEIRKHERPTAEVARIREIVERHALPSFVTGFDVRLGDFDGEPALWIVFHMAGGEEVDSAELEARATQMESVRDAIQDDLLAEVDDRYPFFRSSQDGVRASPK